MLIFSAFPLFVLFLCPTQAEDVTALYLEVSMELIAAMKDTDADEAELHQLAKDIVYYADDQQQLQNLYDAYLVNKSDVIKDAFINNYMHKKRLEYVKERVDKILSYYLTRDQIARVKQVLEREAETAKSSNDLIAAIKEELAKEISTTKAENAIEMVTKQLRILAKRYVGWLEKANKLIFSLIKHDEQ